MSDPRPPCGPSSGPFSGKPARTRVLAADDDPVSLRFLEGALRELGCEVAAVADGGAAIEAARAQSFDLLLLDRRMPGLGGAELLFALRRCGVNTTAIATSADIDASVRDEMSTAGYAECLLKPIRIDALARIVSAYFPGARPAQVAETQASGPTAPLLDDAMALLAVGGDDATMTALRVLLVRDLDALIASDLPESRVALADALHRLRAACSYCGAVSLERMASTIEATIRSGDAPAATALQSFLRCCAETGAAIGDRAAAAISRPR